MIVNIDDISVNPHNFPVLRMYQPAKTLPVEMAIECGNKCRPDVAADSNRTAEKYNGALYSIENAVILVRRFDSETARGVLCVINLRGITGNGAQYFSTITKKQLEIRLVIRSPRIKGSDHSYSSAVFKLIPKRKQPTAATSVREPRKSMRQSFSESF